MTTKERFLRMYRHEEADRIPIIDSPWAGTIRRWEKEGMPKGMDWTEYFDTDKTASISVDITPRYEEKILEEVLARHDEVEQLLADPAVYADGAKAAELLKEFHELQVRSETELEALGELEAEIAELEAKRAALSLDGGE